MEQDKADPDVGRNTVFVDGLRVRRAVLGDEYVDRALSAGESFGADFQRYVTESCWGLTWGREALPLGSRSLVTVAILAALGRANELELHLEGALRNGCSSDELLDTIFHVATYAGVPAGVEALRITRAVLEKSGRPE